MRFVFVTRNFNHSGFAALNRLIDEGIEIAAVVVPEEGVIHPIALQLAKFFYSIEVWFYRCAGIRNFSSEIALARRNRIRVIRTPTMESKSFQGELQKLNLDLIVLGGGWPGLIPKSVLGIPKFGCLNTHPSILPSFRGTSITRWQIFHGVHRSGTTIHVIDETFDTGRILAQRAIEVSSDQTPQGLFRDLGDLGATLLGELLRLDPVEIFKTEQKVVRDWECEEYFPKWNYLAHFEKIDWTMGLKKAHQSIMANTQESFKYTGPFVATEYGEYFVRKSSLMTERPSINRQANVLSGLNGIEQYWTDIEEFILWCPNEMFALRIDIVQKCERFRLRRSYIPKNTWLK